MLNLINSLNKKNDEIFPIIMMRLGKSNKINHIFSFLDVKYHSQLSCFYQIT